MTVRIPYEEMEREFRRVLMKHGFSEERAALGARLFTETSLDGVYSHGANRFPMYIDYVRRGIVRVYAEPERVAAFGSLERWDGKLGPGNLNAWTCMGRAIELAREHGSGCVALRNTNHWMRGGTYGRRAADENCIAVCFTNAIPGMPPWGASENRVGNNPFVLAVPRRDGHIVLDMALSQFSYGRMEAHRMSGEPLPVPGGFDSDGHLTDDPGKILGGGTVLPVGYWKGSGLALVLDLIAAILSDGWTTERIAREKDEFSVSQVFLTFSLDRLGSDGLAERLAREVVDYIHTAQPVEGGGVVFVPGERTMRTRRENRVKGIPVNNDVWEAIKTL